MIRSFYAYVLEAAPKLNIYSNDFNAGNSRPD